MVVTGAGRSDARTDGASERWTTQLAGLLLLVAVAAGLLGQGAYYPSAQRPVGVLIAAATLLGLATWPLTRDDLRLPPVVPALALAAWGFLDVDLPQRDGGRAGGHRPGGARAADRDAWLRATRVGGDRAAGRAGRDDEPGGRARPRGRPGGAGRAAGAWRDRAGRGRPGGRRPGGPDVPRAVDAGRQPTTTGARAGRPGRRAGPCRARGAVAAMAGARAAGLCLGRRCRRAACHRRRGGRRRPDGRRGPGQPRLPRPDRRAARGAPAGRPASPDRHRTWTRRPAMEGARPWHPAVRVRPQRVSPGRGGTRSGGPGPARNPAGRDRAPAVARARHRPLGRHLGWCGRRGSGLRRPQWLRLRLAPASHRAHRDVAGRRRAPSTRHRSYPPAIHPRPRKGTR